jgi:branched-chain amino acid transport system substrate-binding protein
MKSVLRVILVVLGVCFFVSINLNNSLAQESIKIGAVISTTGWGALSGIQYKNTMILAEDYLNKKGGINGHSLKIIYEDDESNPAKASIVAKRLIENENVVAIVSAPSGACGKAIGLVARPLNTIVISTSPSRTVYEGNNWVFSVNPPADISSKSTALFMNQFLNVKKLGLMHDAGEWATDDSNQVKKEAAALGIRIVGQEKFQMSDVDFTPTLLKLRRDGADCLYVTSIGPAPAAIAKNLRTIGWNVTVVGSPGVGSRDFLKMAAGNAEGWYLVSFIKYFNSTPEEKLALDLYKAKYKEEMQTMIIGSWDVVFLMAEVIKNVGFPLDKVKIRDGFENIRGFKGALGEYNYYPDDHSGHNIKALKYLKVKGDGWVHSGWEYK